MKEYLSLKEIQIEELSMLKILVSIFEDNNIKYFVCGGTLLGAIRHKGFIPWDDDIDVLLPRPDYEKFVKIFDKVNTQTNLKLCSPELNTNFQPFSKIVNTTIEIKDNSVCDQKTRYLWVDIFPLDGLPNNKTILKFKYWIISKLKKMLYIREYKTDYSNKKNLFKNILRSFIRPISFIVSAKTIIRIAKGNYEKAKYVGDMVWGYGPQEKMPKEMAENYIKVDFEDIKVNALAEYDKFLTNIYGDYMKLPPIEKRATHSIKAWRVDN